MYRYVAVPLFSHTTGFSIEKTISVLQQAVSFVLGLYFTLFIDKNILANPVRVSGENRQNNWTAQRDQTQHLTELETTAFAEAKKIFFVPLIVMETLDGDLFGTRAAENHVKMQKDRKAGKERHVAHAVSDALSRVIYALVSRQRGVSQSGVRKNIGEALG